MSLLCRPSSLRLLHRVIWFNVLVETALPALAVYGVYTTTLRASTLSWCCYLYLVNMLGVTAGYHRLWSHRSYRASWLLQLVLCLCGSGAIQGSILWWSRLHRAHHRYTDTSRDPYGADRGLWHSHLGWMLVKPENKPGTADISDLRHNGIVAWQHKYYFPIAFVTGLLIPICVAGWLWDDWRGGLFFSGFARLLFVHHSVFCVNSIAHYLGETTYDDRLSPRDSLITALLTLGEGYHNFHHQFPMDYRSAARWYQYDPTKWFISMCWLFGLASHLKVFPEDGIRKGRLTMQLKELKKEQDGLRRPPSTNTLPVVDWKTFQDQARSRPLVLIAGFIHDMTDFTDEHPGGRNFLLAAIGKDASAEFFGGVYDHSNSAHNVLAELRVGILRGGLECASDFAVRPPWQRWEIVEHGDNEERAKGAGIKIPE